MSFSLLATAAPEIAEPFRERLSATGLVLLGTLRSDGAPRVSPIEAFVHDGELFAGGMPGSVKCRDLQRDPRCCVLTTIADKDDLWGEVKLHGRARELLTSAERAPMLEGLRREMPHVDAADLGDFHAFAFSVESAAHQRVDGDTWLTVSWRAGEDVRTRRRR